MKYLFVHQNFPAQYLHLVRHLAREAKSDVVFITEPNQNVIPGVRTVPYARPQFSGPETHVSARDLDNAVRRAEVVAVTAERLKALGFTPDIIIGHHGWGELLSLPEVWPDVPILGYMEFFYRTNEADVGFDPEFPTAMADFARIRVKNAVNLIALEMPGHGQTPTKWQLSTYPGWARSRITLLPEGVDLTTCRPDPAVRRGNLQIGEAVIRARDKLVTYVSRDLEPYRGVHTMMRSLPYLFANRRDVKVVMVGGDGVSYGMPPAKGCWREVMLDELGRRLDRERLILPGRLDYQTYIRMLQRSDAHVYLTYPFVASWSLREALAIGCAVVGSDTPPVREFVTDRVNGRLVPFFDAKGLADCITELLEDRGQSEKLRRQARNFAERNLAMEDYLAAYDALIARLTGREAFAISSAGPARQAARRVREKAT